MSVPSGWYNDPQDPALVRYWDGIQWTAHVQPIQPQPVPPHSVQPPRAPQLSAQPQQHVQQTQNVERGRGGAVRKVGFFGAKKTAETALADVELLQRILDERGLLEFDQIEASWDELRRIAENERQEWASESQCLQGQLHSLRAELAQAEGRLVTSRASAALQEVGVFDFEHPAEHSAHLAARLDVLRTQYKEMARAKLAIHATSNFTFNNSAKQGEKLVNQMSTIMLRAYNAEAENCVKTVKAGNLATATSRLTKAKEQIERQGTMISLRVDEQYHHLRIQEMVLAANTSRPWQQRRKWSEPAVKTCASRRRPKPSWPLPDRSSPRNVRCTRPPLTRSSLTATSRAPNECGLKLLKTNSLWPTSNGARRTSVPATCTLSPTSAPSERTWSRSA